MTGSVTAFVGVSYFNEDGSQRTPAQFDERVLLARIAGALNGGGLIPGRPASDPAPIGLFANPAFTGALLQGVAAANGYALPAPLAQAIAANLKANHSETTTNFSETDSFDIFGDITFRLSDRFEIGLGARYSHDSKSTAITSAVVNGRSILGGFLGALSQPEPTRTGLLTALAAPGAATIPPSALYPVPLFGLTFQPTTNNGDLIGQDLNDSSFTWRVTARYAPTPNSSLYANYARGRRPEVLSALPPAAPFGPARFTNVDAETVDSFEVGARTRTAGGRLFLDGAFFYYSLPELPDDGADRHDLRHHQCRRGQGLWLRRRSCAGGRAPMRRCSPPTPSTTAASPPASATATASASRPITPSRSAPSSASTSARAGSASCRA